MKRLLMMCCVLMAAVCVMADTVEWAGIYYNLVEKAKQAEVISNPNPNKYYSGIVVLPSTIEYNGVEYSVTKICDDAFAYCHSLTAVTIPNSVTTIGDYAFMSTGLTSITIPNGVTSIGYSTFRYCTGLTSVTIPNSVTNIGEYAFYECKSLTDVTIPNGVKSIGGHAFSACYNLTSITIPSSLTVIDDYAFISCTGLKKVIVKDIAAWCGISFYTYTSNPLVYGHHLYSDENTEITDLIVPKGVTEIKFTAFSNCSSLTSVSIPNSVTGIGDYAFDGCSGLTSVTIPNSVTSIGGHAFFLCTGLTSITIPNSVTNIDGNAFYGCTGLTSVNIPNSLTNINGETFYGCTSLTSVTIPNNVTSIGLRAFAKCTSLTSITIPNSVTYIGRYAFDNCTGLTSINIGNNAKLTIGGSAFASCKELQDVYCLCEKVPSTDADAFRDSYIEYATLHVPAVAYNDYKTTAPWNQFGKIVTTDDEGSETMVVEVKARPLLVLSQNGFLTIQGVDDGQSVSVYNTSGQLMGIGTSVNGTANVDTKMNSGEIALVKIGTQSVKVMLR